MDFFVTLVDYLVSLTAVTEGSVPDMVGFLNLSWVIFTYFFVFQLLVLAKRFYLTGDMMYLYPFIQGSLESPFKGLFSADASLCNQYKYIAFNIFSWRILIISYKMLIITGISDEKTK